MEGHNIAERKANRLQEWKDWLNDYLVGHSDVTLIPNAAELLNEYYWKLVTVYLKPLLQAANESEHNLHYYKIISASEITVMAVMPLMVPEDDNDIELQSRKRNADFAMFVALTILNNWKIGGATLISEEKLAYILDTKEIIVSENETLATYPQTLMDEHVAWLVALNTAAALPVISNGQTWRAIFLASKN